jgi:tetratricopeptide (TPR) repeat protein
MSEPTAKKEKDAEPSFKLNYATIILLLVILIPMLYTVFTNLQPKAGPPVITPAAANTNTATATSSSAIETALKAVADNPSYQTYLNLGLAYYGASKYTESVEAWRKALGYNPKSDLAYNNIAAAYGAMNMWDEEIEACKQALAINPNFDLAKRNLKWAQEMKDKK